MPTTKCGSRSSTDLTSSSRRPSGSTSWTLPCTRVIETNMRPQSFSALAVPAHSRANSSVRLTHEQNTSDRAHDTAGSCVRRTLPDHFAHAHVVELVVSNAIG